MDGLHLTQLSPIKADRHQSHQSRPQSTGDDADDDYNGEVLIPPNLHIINLHHHQRQLD